MIGFDKEKRAFRTIDLFGLIGIVGITTALVSAFAIQGFEDDRGPRAQSTAHAVALQLQAKFERELSKKDGSRAPASSVAGFGRIGRDPWGQPYRYMVQSPETLPNYIRIYVWSSGPNGVDDTGPETLEAKARPMGDDVAFVHDFKANL